MDYQQVYADIKVLFDSLSVKIGEVAVSVWDIVVRQQEVIGVAMIMGSVAAYVSAVVVIHYSNQCSKRRKELNERQGSGEWLAGAVVFRVLALAPGAVGTWLAINGVMHIMNPEFYAIHYFIMMVKAGSGAL